MSSKSRAIVATVLKHFALFVVYGTLGATLALLTAYVVYLNSGPELKPWHEAKLDAEFRAGDEPRVRTLADYRYIEARVFEQLLARVHARVGADDASAVNRYSTGSLSDPLRYAVNWNRTIELPVSSPRRGALLVHGLSDSPYSMRALAERLHAEGYHVVVLRLPGHGTAPAGLLNVKWEDWAAALRIGVRHVRERIGAGAPLYIVGYSTGAALGVEYALARSAGANLPRVDGLVLLSPAIGVSPAAALAVWQARLARVPGLQKIAWESLVPEYDPYKYQSFPINAAVQIHALTAVIAERVSRLASPQGMRGLPRIVAFQSAADSTVSAEALVRVLFGHLAPEGHRLVVFDINRSADAQFILVPDAASGVDRLLSRPSLPFALTVVKNADPHGSGVSAFERAENAAELTRTPIELAWPEGIFSLSHVGLPFPLDDPHYGAAPPAVRQGIYLGRPKLQGELGFLALPERNLMRLRFNPFYSYMEREILKFIDADTAGEPRP